MNEEAVDRPEWADVLEDEIGEDPTRFLIGSFGPIDVPPLVESRIQGIDDIEVANAWIAAERRLGFNRRGVIGRLENRIEQLDELGERSERIEGDRSHSAPKDIVFFDEDGAEISPESRSYELRGYLNAKPERRSSSSTSSRSSDDGSSQGSLGDFGGRTAIVDGGTSDGGGGSG